ncbi:hypothetical protein Q3G72_032010 [Acer saccharum]|nr:hypothetical protein Q3G72_032010 [Acer saccharum]
MMPASSKDRPQIIPPSPDGIPSSMRQAKRWAPWRAEWNEKKQKYVKIPHRADRPEHGLSNKSAVGWVTFEHAMAAYRAAPDKFAGVGYLMTGAHGVTGVDLDHCVVDGQIAPWAAEVAAKLDSYTEISPSGTGLHVMSATDVPIDWMNHDRGIEVYGGNAARFLCITGRRVDGSPQELRAPRAGVLDALAVQYKKVDKTASVEDLHLPDLIPVELLPDLVDLDLPPHARNFLAEGSQKSDRSSELFACAIALSQAGLAPDEILSVLEANEHAMQIALDHRRQDYDKALRFLWKEAAQRGTARAGDFKQATFDDFEDFDSHESGNPVPAPAGTDDFDVLPEQDNRHADLAPVKKHKFAPESVAQFLNRPAPNWIIKGVVPRAGLAVIYGASSSGKTFFTLDLVGAIARGTQWRGTAVKRGRVLYVVAEGAGGFRNRLQAYCEFHGVDPDDFDVCFLRQAPNLLAKDDIREFLEQVLAAGRFDVIVIDTYARAMAGGNENDAKDVGQAVAHCDAIHRKTGALVVLVHHSGKDATKGARGSGALRAAADLEIEVVQTREYRAATVTKQKDGADGAEYRFKLAEVVLGDDEDGEDMTSCVIEHRDDLTGPSREAVGLKGNNARVLKTVQGMLDLDEELTYAAAIDAAVLQIPHDETKRDRRRDTVIRALQDLESKDLLKITGGLVSLQ